MTANAIVDKYGWTMGRVIAEHTWFPAMGENRVCWCGHDADPDGSRATKRAQWAGHVADVLAGWLPDSVWDSERGRLVAEAEQRGYDSGLVDHLAHDCCTGRDAAKLERERAELRERAIANASTPLPEPTDDEARWVYENAHLIVPCDTCDADVRRHCVNPVYRNQGTHLLRKSDAMTAFRTGKARCKIVNTIRDETTNAQCVTHGRWVDETAEGYTPNPEHLAAIALGAIKIQSEP